MRAFGRGGIRRFFLAVVVIIIFLSFVNVIFFHNGVNKFIKYVDGLGEDVSLDNANPRLYSSSGVSFPLSDSEVGLDKYLLRIINVTCPSDYLNFVTDYAQKICSNESAEVCQMLTCKNLLTGSPNDFQYGIAQNLMAKHPRNLLPDEAFMNAAVRSDCESFKRNGGYHLKALSREEEEFPIAFNLLVHTNVHQVERLLRAIYRPQNIYCIHFDTKSTNDFKEAIISISSCFDNIQLASKMENLIYAGYSRLQADITCMRQHLESKVRWKYLINTAGQAYPLRTVAEMVRILKIYNGANDIEGIHGIGVVKERITKEWVEDLTENAVVRTGEYNPKPPHQLDIIRGSAYGVFSRKFVKFIMEDEKAIDLLEWSKKTFSPDEHYWATLHHTYSNPQLHTPGRYSGYPNNKTFLAVFANWDETTCRGQMMHSVCIFGVGDLPELVTRKEFFANKFYLDFEPLTFDCIEAWTRQKEVCPLKLDEIFYLNLSFIIGKD